MVDFHSTTDSEVIRFGAKLNEVAKSLGRARINFTLGRVEDIGS